MVCRTAAASALLRLHFFMKCVAPSSTLTRGPFRLVLHRFCGPSVFYDMKYWYLISPSAHVVVVRSGINQSITRRQNSKASAVCAVPFIKASSFMGTTNRIDTADIICYCRNVQHRQFDRGYNSLRVLSRKIVRRKRFCYFSTLWTVFFSNGMIWF